MKAELEQKIFDRFEFINKENICYSELSCSNGWFNLIWKLFEDIEKVLNGDKKQFSVAQVKEKFGGLRVSVSNAQQEILDLVDEAENKSFNVCEICGSEKNVKTIESITGYLQTLCESCYANENIID